MSFSSMMLLNDLSKLDSSVRYLNLTLESPKSKFEVPWRLQWKFELKPFFIITLSSTAVKGNFLLVHVRHSHSHLSFWQHFLCIGEKQDYLFLLQTCCCLQVVVFILLLISVISLLISFLGLPFLIKILCNCVLLTSWNEIMSFQHILQYLFFLIF